MNERFEATGRRWESLQQQLSRRETQLAKLESRTKDLQRSIAATRTTTIKPTTSEAVQLLEKLRQKDQELQKTKMEFRALQQETALNNDYMYACMRQLYENAAKLLEDNQALLLEFDHSIDHARVAQSQHSEAVRSQLGVLR
jgi:predicted  nucleic acid-binding Zn-ribbon protein